MFNFKENDVVLFTKDQKRPFSVTLMSDGTVYLTASDSHCTLAWYAAQYGPYIVYRCSREQDTALLKRRLFESDFDVRYCDWVQQVYTATKEYTMAQLEAIVGHPFKLIKEGNNHG